MGNLLGFLNYCFVAGITPGPANITSLSTAIRKGRSAALKQWRGIFIGFFVVAEISAFICWLVGTAFNDYLNYFAFVGAAYILWLVYHIYTDDGHVSESEEHGRGVQEGTFMYGFLLQLSNIKIIIFCLTALSGFVLSYRNDLLTLLAVGAFLPFTGPICNLVWLFAGSSLEHLFEKHHKLLNTVMALSLVYCAVAMIMN